MNEVSINQQNQKTTKMFKTNFFFFFFFFFFYIYRWPWSNRSSSKGPLPDASLHSPSERHERSDGWPTRSAADRRRAVAPKGPRAPPRGRRQHGRRGRVRQAVGAERRADRRVDAHHLPPHVVRPHPSVGDNLVCDNRGQHGLRRERGGGPGRGRPAQRRPGRQLVLRQSPSRSRYRTEFPGNAFLRLLFGFTGSEYTRTG